MSSSSAELLACQRFGGTIEARNQAPAFSGRTGKPHARSTMKTTIGWSVIAILMLGAGGAPDAKKEVAKFAGIWNLSELTYNGKDHSKLNFKVTFKGDEAVIEGNDAVK